MSGAPPPQPNTKTHHFTDFLRGPSSSSTVQFPDDPHVHSDTGPSEDATTSPSKRRSTRIPLFGRSRKKSTFSETTTDSRASEAQQGGPSEAQPGRASTATNTSRPFLNEHPLHARASLSQQSLTLPPHQPTEHHSFGSKIVAHFTPSKTRGLLTPRKSRKSRSSSPSKPEDVPGYTSDTLSPPVHDIRSGSTDSISSREDLRDPIGGLQSGLVTPTQPTITVSRPPLDAYEDLSEYEDLFTKPRQKAKSKPTPIQVPAPERHKLSVENSFPLSSPPPATEADAGPSSVAFDSSLCDTPTSTQLSSLDISVPSQITAVLSTNESPSGRKSPTIRDQNVPDNTSGSPPSRKRLDSNLRAQAGAGTEKYSAAEESDAMSVTSPPFSGSPHSAQRRSINALLQDQKAVSGLPYKPKERSHVSTLARSRPPMIPLPATPSTSAKVTTLPRQRARAQTVVASTSKVARNEVSLKRHSSASSKLLLSSSTHSQEVSGKSEAEIPAEPKDNNRNSNSSTSSSSTPTLTKSHFPQLQPTNVDIDNASVEELRAALRHNNARFKELASHLIRMMDMHSQEKALMEKRISTLEREIARKDKEIKGWTWLVKNPRGSESVGPLLDTERASATPDISDDSSARSSRLVTPTNSIRMPVYVASEDSGAESYATSGAESSSRLGFSGAESDPTSRPKRSMRKLKLVENFHKSNQTPQPHTIRKAEGHALETILGSSNILRLNKHSSAASVYSTSSSGSSPFSSPTSMSFAAAGLTAIPETVQPAAQGHKDKKERERKVSATRLSSPQPSKPSSTAASTRLTPSEAYAMNLKKDRPPSIAQVLDNGGNTSATKNIMEESFGGRSRALLGLVPSKTNAKPSR
ncbi:hypothetical protein WG66_015403 [Moniliophthora roreri]|uniref:Uncharacterized protein n=1 Tax=Moniliophthora roreri TaxID=221103 RepID=A0A0W0G377_MONRR|nr:hypothetical protein WG66_015403 [Moniliophthora roreri]